MNRNIFLFKWLFVAVAFCGCTKKDDPVSGGGTTTNGVTVQTTATVTAAQITATVTGNITVDGGNTVTQRGFCWNTSPTPTIANNKLLVGSGTGSFTGTLPGLTYNTTYYVRAFAITSKDTVYGAQVSFTTLALSIPGGGVTDADGNTYKTVILGGKEWMAENLRTTKYKNGDVVTNAPTNANWLTAYTSASGAWCYYNNTAGYNGTYGKLYNWYAGTDTRQIAPTGWHVPSSGEWAVLSAYLGGDAVSGGALKSSGFSDWASPNTGATNISGFNALPGGGRAYYQGNFDGFGAAGGWWTTSSRVSIILYNNKTLFDMIGYAELNTGYSIRCVKD